MLLDLRDAQSETPWAKCRQRFWNCDVGWSKIIVMAISLQDFKANFFRALAHPVRIRILEVLGKGERNVQELQEVLGLDQPIVSQQLAILRGKNIVTPRKVGTTVQYALSDPLLTKLLAVARAIFNNHLIDTQTMLRELQREARR